MPSFKTQTRFPAGKNPRALAVTDLNGDGLSDVVVANRGPNDGDDEGSVLVLMGDAGTLFKTGVSLKPGRNPRGLVADDFNRDGKADVAVLVWPQTSCCLQGAVTLLLGDGTGNLTETGVLNTIGSSASSMVGGDFNADGNPDVAVWASGSPSPGVYVLLGNGAGGFGAPVLHPTGGNGGQLAVGDFNGDGRLDIAAANVNFGYAILLGDGAGGFGPASNTSLAPLNASSIVAGDFNRDGRLDLAAVGGNTVKLLTGDGTGKFTAGPNVFILDISYMAASGDFNGDGNLDLAVTNWSSSASILLGDGAGGFAPSRNFGAGVAPTYFVVGDFDRDGKSDMLTADASDNDLTLLRGEGTGDFKAPAVFRAALGPFHAAASDFNGDGRPDLAVANISQSQVTILLGSGSEKFTPGATVFTTNPSSVAVADFNGDGKRDIAVTNSGPFTETVSVSLGDGAGGFGAPSPFKVGSNPRALVAADLNNDGDADLAVVNSDSNDVSVLLGDGGGGFTAAAPVTVGGFPHAIITADFNRDCNADLVVLGGSNNGSILFGDGDGRFTTPAALSTPLGSRSVAAGDVDGDGVTDLVFAHRDAAGDGSAGAAVVYRGDGSGGFGAPASFGVGKRRELTALGDFNGDGLTDIALLNESRSASVLLNRGAGTFSAVVDFPVSTIPSFLLATDVSGEGSADLVMRHVTDNVGVLFNACAGAARAARPAGVQFSAPCFGAREGGVVARVGVTRTGDLSGPVTVDYFTSNGTANEVSDYTTALGTLSFAAGESDKTLRIILTDDSFVETAETLHVTLTNPEGAAPGAPASATVIIKDADAAAGPNPITAAAANHQFFVRQHYADFLNREPDADGLNFWKSELDACGANAACVEVKRINVSAAFFLSIEFQETGYLAYRMHKAAYGDATSPNVAGTVPVIRFREFLADSQRIGQSVQVNVGDWRGQLEANKNAYALDFVGRERFQAAYPSTLTATEFVSRLDQNAGGVLSPDEKVQLVNALSAGPADARLRAQTLRHVADHATLRQTELNRAFVLMQYFGYLRRNPDDPQDMDFRGWKFWLDKLNEFGGNFVQAEMVKAFLDADEYKRRFGQ